MNIGIDLDGVLFDTEATFKAYSQVFDLKNGKYGISFPEELRVQKRYPWPKDVLDKFFNETLFQVVKDAQFMPMSKQVLNAIAKRNKIYIITNRGSINPQKEIEVTNERLKDSPFPYEKILFSCTDKLKVCQELKIDIMIDSGPSARSVQIAINPFTLVGATTRSGLLTSPLRSRFGINLRLQYYDTATLGNIIKRSAAILKIPINDESAYEIASRSRGTPRIANLLLRRVRDFAQVKGDGAITLPITQIALEALNVDKHGLDEMDNRILSTIIDKFKGGPVGLTTIATAVSEDAGTIEEVYEPFLIQEGYLMRTPRGREVTALAYQHLGKTRFASDQPELF